MAERIEINSVMIESLRFLDFLEISLKAAIKGVAIPTKKIGMVINSITNLNIASFH